MDISVVLCTYNNAERLRVTLQSFCRLNEPEKLDWELVAVNNNSTDNTETVIRSFGDRLPIRYVYEPEQGLSRARNAGLEVAQGELIVFTDDDVIPNPEWLAAYWDAYQKRPEGYYFGGPIESEYEGDPPDEDLLRVAFASVSGLDYGTEARELPSHGYLVGANWACPSDHLEQVGSFDERLGLNAEGGVGEETELMSRLEEQGVRGWYIPGAKIAHFVPQEKSTLSHIVSRYTSNIYIEEESIFYIMGIPIGLYYQVLIRLINWLARMVAGGEWKKEYVYWRVWLSRAVNHHKG